MGAILKSRKGKAFMIGLTSLTCVTLFEMDPIVTKGMVALVASFIGGVAIEDGLRGLGQKKD